MHHCVTALLTSGFYYSTTSHQASLHLRVCYIQTRLCRLINIYPPGHWLPVDRREGTVGTALWPACLDRGGVSWRPRPSPSHETRPASECDRVTLVSRHGLAPSRSSRPGLRHGRFVRPPICAGITVSTGLSSGQPPRYPAASPGSSQPRAVSGLLAFNKQQFDTHLTKRSWLSCSVRA